MRFATIGVVLIIHAVFFILFAALRTPASRSVRQEAPSIAFFLPLNEVDTQREGAPQPPTMARAAHPPSSKRAPPTPKSPTAVVTPRSVPPSNAIALPATPDWRRELQIAANSQMEAEERKRHQPSPLAPHDFSGVKPGSTDDTQPQFGWSHAATHRVEEIPSGGLLININDRCVIAWVIFPFPLCRVGKIPARGDLFEHMQDTPALGESKLP